MQIDGAVYSAVFSAGMNRVAAALSVAGKVGQETEGGGKRGDVLGDVADNLHGDLW